jgi:hypothetical protein
MDGQGATLQAGENPVARAARGETFLASLWLPLENGETREFEVSARPTTLAGNQQLGVITLRECPEA